jgi:1-deoxy-D-xylulose-5-phosphate synthase
MKDLNEGMYPADIKKLTMHEMELLCDDIRDRLITAVSENGGHLASNLGIVELTVALHRVFNAPEDKIVWDVGHQSYVHKMLTGRAADFTTLRQLDGLSGFPKRSESEYDTFDTGHSSNSISAALGMAAARDFRGEDHSVVAVIGDGALTGGMAYEALNNAGVMDSSMIVILNDNAMSISKDHGSMSQHLGKLRTSERYTSFKHNLKSALKHIPAVGDAVCNVLENMRDAVKYMVVPGVLFEELGFVYLGPVDGHSLPELTEVFRQAKLLKKPVLVHCITQKGKGYRPAEKQPDRFHGVAPFERETGKAKSPSKRNTWSDIFGRKLKSMAAEDKRIVAVSAAMVDGTGLAEFAKSYPDRIFDVGIAEEHAVTFAAGMAASGMRPVVAIYSTFMQRAYDQIMTDVCMQKLPVVFCIDRAGIVGADGETHHGIFDLSYMQHMPGMTILAPSDGGELRNMLEYAMTLDSPCTIRYPRGEVNEMTAEEASEWKPVPRVIREGTDITVLAVGKMVERCLKAAETLSADISCEVIDARIIRPVLAETVDIYRKSAKKTKCIVTVEDNVIAGGFGSVIEEIFAADTEVRVYKVGWPDKFISQGTQSELETRYGLDTAGIADKVRKIIEGKA